MKNIFFNKYFITFIVFVLWLIFFDKNDFFTQAELNRQLKKLSDEKKYYQTEIEKNKIFTNELKNNMQSIEKYAREEYLMKRDDEDIYLIKNR